MPPAFTRPSFVSCTTDSTTGAEGVLGRTLETTTVVAMAAPLMAIHGQCPFDCAVMSPLLGALPESESASRTKARSDAEWNRCSGFFSRQRSSTFCRASEMLGAICDGEPGSSLRIELMVSADVGL